MSRSRDGSVLSGTRVRADYSHALASVSTGEIVEGSTAGPSIARLEALASTLPALFGDEEGPPLARLREHLGGEVGRRSVQEIVIISKEHVHVIEPLPKNPGLSLLMVTGATRSLGLVLSTVHAKLSEFEGE